MSFKVGEKLVFIGCPLNRIHPDSLNSIPKKGEVVTYAGLSKCDPSMIRIEEYPNRYNPIYFRKLSDVSSELSEEILEKIKVTEEEPITV